MTIKERCWIFFFLIFTYPQIHLGQVPELRFQHITSENGLPQNTIHGIVKDKFGFMWFGTWGGLCRYDGYNFKTYRYDSKNSRSINSNRIHNIIKDKDDSIWMLTFEEDELCRYSYETDDFDRIPAKNVSPKFLSLLIRRDHYASVNYLYKEYKWNLNIYSNSLVQTNGISKKKTSYTFSQANRWSLNDPYVTDIYKDDQNVLWVGTYSNGINKAHINAKPFNYYYHDPYNPNSVIDNNIRAICEDDLGNLWIGTRDKGITIIGNGTYKHIKSSKGTINSDRPKGS
jgi:ligand-binding sensor domain-containing protein